MQSRSRETRDGLTILPDLSNPNCIPAPSGRTQTTP
jgi:hypothetical protein